MDTGFFVPVSFSAETMTALPAPWTTDVEVVPMPTDTTAEMLLGVLAQGVLAACVAAVLLLVWAYWLRRR